MSLVHQLDEEFTRADFDKIFDAHWHSGYMLRHMVYLAAQGLQNDTEFKQKLLLDDKQNLPM